MSITHIQRQLLLVERYSRQIEMLQTRIIEAKRCIAAASNLARPATWLLTNREMQVLVMIAQGYSDKQIAARHSITFGTVQTHVDAIRRKLKVTSRTQAALYAWRNGVISIDEAWATVETYQWRDRMVSQCVLEEDGE